MKIIIIRLGIVLSIASGILVLSVMMIVPSIAKNQEIHSPLPSFLTRTANASVTTLNVWVPNIATEKQSGFKKPDVSARSALLYDLSSNELIYSKNIKNKLPMASLTKIMTAIIALENRVENDRYFVDTSTLVGENIMGATAGETYTLKELLYGLILVSGNDAAEILAWNYPFGRKGFLDAMNQKARSLGLTDTHFTNPSGLEGDGNQHTTAFDLLVITRFGLANSSLLKEVVSTFEKELPYSKFHKYLYFQNETNLLSSYPGVKGVKTGFTPESGLCLVTYFQNYGHEMIGVVLGSNNRRDDMKNMLDYALKVYNIQS